MEAEARAEEIIWRETVMVTAASTPIMTMTTSISVSVNPEVRRWVTFLLFRIGRWEDGLQRYPIIDGFMRAPSI